MRPATNINELANNLIPGRFLTQDEANVYVPVYEELIDDIRDRVIYDQLPHQTIFVSGQSGTGKTTALNFLPNPEINDQFKVIKVYANELFDLDDIDTIDVLLMLSFTLMEQNKSLEKTFNQELDKIRKKHEGTFNSETIRETQQEKSGGVQWEAQLGNDPISRFFGLFKISGNFFANFKVDRKYRQITREAFSFNKLDLLDLTNRIIQKYEDLLPEGKHLLLIINELDHIKKPKLINDLFITNRYYLEKLQCKKVISVPAILNTFDTFNERIYFFGIKLSHNKLTPSLKKGEDKVTSNWSLLEEIVFKRIAEDADLIDKDAVLLAIENCGGIIRQFISILYYSATLVRRLKGTKIKLADVLHGCDTLRQTLEGSIIFKEKIEILDQIRTANKPLVPEDEMFMEMLQGNRILIYQNDPTWYELNPLIEDTVRIYAQRSNE